VKLRAAQPVSDGDAELLVRIASGDQAALGALYDRHCAALHRFVARATCGHADVDDLVHDAFLTAARIAARYDGRGSARPWLIGIAARLVQRRGRTLARIPRLLARFAWSRPHAVDPITALESRSEIDVVLPVIARMAPAKRIVLLMAELEDLTGPEIAEALGIPVGTVWTRLHSARRELIAALGSER